MVMAQRELVVIAAAAPWAGTRLLDQHLARELARYADVLYVDPPVSFLTRFRNPAAAAASGPAGLRQVEPGVTRLAVRALPLKERRGMKRVTIALTRRAMRKAVRELRTPGVRACIVPSLDPLFGAVRERYSVLYAADDFLAGARLMGLHHQQIARLAEEQPRKADIVVAVSPVIVDSMRARGADPLLIPNGVDVDHFAATTLPPLDEANAEPVVAFVGHLSERIDVSLLAAVAATGVRLRMIGPRQTTLPEGHLGDLSGGNVEWVGPVPYEDLPAHLADAVTCVVPYGDSDFNRASFPLKILEYLAAGRRLVTTDLPAVRWLETDLIEVASGPDAFAAAVRRSLETPLTAEEVARRRAFATGHSWQSRVAVLADALGLRADR
jgi:teichuronic acid biosynthesis glycosyltransferase TuaH